MTQEHILALTLGAVATLLLSALLYSLARFKWLKGFDIQDCLLASGFIALETGVAFIDWRAACILAGILFFAFAYLIERTKTKESIGHPQS